MYDPKPAQEHARNFLYATSMGKNARLRNADRSPLRDSDFKEHFGKMSLSEIAEWAKWWYTGYDMESKKQLSEKFPDAFSEKSC